MKNIEPVKDNPRLSGYNVDVKSKELVEYFQNMATHYRTNLLMHTFGIINNNINKQLNILVNLYILLLIETLHFTLKMF